MRFCLLHLISCHKILSIECKHGIAKKVGVVSTRTRNLCNAKCYVLDKPYFLAPFSLKASNMSSSGYNLI